MFRVYVNLPGGLVEISCNQKTCQTCCVLVVSRWEMVQLHWTWSFVSASNVSLLVVPQRSKRARIPCLVISQYVQGAINQQESPMSSPFSTPGGCFSGGENLFLLSPWPAAHVFGRWGNAFHLELCGSGKDHQAQCAARLNKKMDPDPGSATNMEIKSKRTYQISG